MNRESCLARGCNWDNTVLSVIPSCYVPKEKGGYNQTNSPRILSNAVTRYSLSRLSRKPLRNKVNSNSRRSNLRNIISTQSNEFSIYGHDVDHLNVQVSQSGTNMIRVTIRDDDKQRYEVPVPIRWESSVSSSLKAKMKFEITKTSYGQTGFRLRRTDTQSILFDTSYFAEGFIYDNQYLQLITTIPSRNVYGK